MPNAVYCDNKDCIFYDDCRGCVADRLVIERGVCVGSTLHGHNVSENDLDERLKAENDELRYKVHILEGGNRELKVLYDSVKANNDRLRELVETMRVDMHEMLDIIIKSSDVWGYCRYYAERLDAAEDIMRERGVEVDG